jgi:[ribosomal protein S5]-alanine N-acetyltransferase
MIVPLETKRLFLRPLQLADAAETERLFPQWEIVRFLNARVPWPWPNGLALRLYRDGFLPATERGEEWHWSLRLKESPERLIGKISLQQNECDNRG